ncbi:malonic semialdehyde reductase [uncultured Sphingomonas sp.]|uniref:malonic semialdehyde reductase n=1 Tax=uncultured Sphingomonas sp. TaxID=158754 RepID=UPI0035C99B3B
MKMLDEATLAALFTDARSQNGWLPDPVSDEELRAAYDIAKWGPTSMNTQPMRLVFLRSEEGRERLKPALAPTNIDKVMTAPVVAIIAFDAEFFTLLPRVFPHNPNAASYFTGNPAVIQPTAFRNGSMQAAYYMLALRAVGLDVGPMSGFDPGKVDAEFFADSSWRTNLVCGIGHGDPNKVFGRSPRLEFGEVARII